MCRINFGNESDVWESTDSLCHNKWTRGACKIWVESYSQYEYIVNFDRLSREALAVCLVMYSTHNVVGSEEQNRLHYTDEFLDFDSEEKKELMDVKEKINLI